MFLTVHSTAGVIVSQYTPNPIIAFVLGFISHFVLDAIPHGDDEIFTDKKTGQTLVKKIAVVAFVDFLLAIMWLYFLFTQDLFVHPMSAVSAVAGSMLPDFLNGTYIVTRIKLLQWNAWLNTMSHKVFVRKPVGPALGFAIQLVFFTALIIFLFQ